MPVLGGKMNTPISLMIVFPPRCTNTNHPEGNNPPNDVERVEDCQDKDHAHHAAVGGKRKIDVGQKAPEGVRLHRDKKEGRE